MGVPGISLDIMIGWYSRYYSSGTPGSTFLQVAATSSSAERRRNIFSLCGNFIQRTVLFFFNLNGTYFGFLVLFLSHFFSVCVRNTMMQNFFISKEKHPQKLPVQEQILT